MEKTGSNQARGVILFTTHSSVFNLNEGCVIQVRSTLNHLKRRLRNATATASDDWIKWQVHSLVTNQHAFD